MPYVNVKVAGKLTREQKEEIVRDISLSLERVAQKPKEHTYVVIDEVPRENWGKGDALLG